MTERVYDNNGFFKSKSNPIARSGILEYAGSSISPELEQDRIYKVWRPDSELNNPETIESFRLVPWFTRHEMAGDSFTDAEKIGIQGVTGEEVYFDESDKTLKSTIKAFGSALRKLIDKGIKELSIGMTCDWLIESGVTKDGQKYDVIQKNIRGNHLASVKEGRAGKDIAVMDSCEIINFAMDKLDFKVTNEVGTMTIEEILAALKEIKPSLDQMKQIQESLKGLTSESVEEITEDSEDEYKEKAEDQEEEETAEDMEEDKDDKKLAMDADRKSVV